MMYIYIHTHIYMLTHTCTHTFFCVTTKRSWISVLIKRQWQHSLAQNSAFLGVWRVALTYSVAFHGCSTFHIRVDMRALTSRLWNLFTRSHGWSESLDWTVQYRREQIFSWKPSLYRVAIRHKNVPRNYNKA